VAPAFAVIAVGLATTAAAATLGRGHGGPHPQISGEVVDRRVPELALKDETGQTRSFASFRGRVVVLTPFLTLCHEVCPLTTGAFETMQRAVAQAGLAKRVVFAEVSVDPWRDTPARLRAFARLTGVHLRLLTGTSAQLQRFWGFFGVAYWRTKEGRPQDRDWLTGRPLTFDVSHTDALFLVDAKSRERIVDVGMPNVGGTVAPPLGRLLNESGRRDLARPTAGWTAEQGLADVRYLLGRTS
jgi:protein SCO1/2